MPGLRSMICLALAASACARSRAAVSAPAECVDDERVLGPPSRLRVMPGAVTSDIAGVIVLAMTSEPLPGARIWIDSTTTDPAETAADGRFLFRGVRPGRHAIVMRRIGVRTLRDSIDVPVAGSLRIEALQPPNDGGCASFGAVTVGKP